MERSILLSCAPLIIGFVRSYIMRGAQENKKINYEKCERKTKRTSKKVLFELL